MASRRKAAGSSRKNDKKRFANAGALLAALEDWARQVAAKWEPAADPVSAVINSRVALGPGWTWEQRCERWQTLAKPWKPRTNAQEALRATTEAVRALEGLAAIRGSYGLSERGAARQGLEQLLTELRGREKWLKAVQPDAGQGGHGFLAPTVLVWEVLYRGCAPEGVLTDEMKTAAAVAYIGAGLLDPKDLNSLIIGTRDAGGPTLDQGKKRVRELVGKADMRLRKKFPALVNAP